MQKTKTLESETMLRLMALNQNSDCESFLPNIAEKAHNYYEVVSKEKENTLESWGVIENLHDLVEHIKKIIRKDNSDLTWYTIMRINDIIKGIKDDYNENEDEEVFNSNLLNTLAHIMHDWYFYETLGYSLISDMIITDISDRYRALMSNTQIRDLINIASSISDQNGYYHRLKEALEWNIRTVIDAVEAPSYEIEHVPYDSSKDHKMAWLASDIQNSHVFDSEIEYAGVSCEFIEKFADAFIIRYAFPAQFSKEMINYNLKVVENHTGAFCYKYENKGYSRIDVAVVVK